MEKLDDKSVIGIDLGGTKILAGVVKNRNILARYKNLVPVSENKEDVIEALFEVIDNVNTEDISGIGIGVPSVVDIEKGIVYDVQNIPSWKEVYLKDILEERYKLPVFINNDANCFAAGEKHFGKGKNFKDFIALIVGTGIAAGIIINNKLYNGSNCGAGEFGMIPYLDSHFEYYCSGQFFNNVHSINGELLYQKVQNGDPKAFKIFQEFGAHLGNAINAILYALDPEVIIIGGSVSKAYPYFKKTMWNNIQKLAYRTVVERLKIEISDNPDIALLGAASLYFDAKTYS